MEVPPLVARAKAVAADLGFSSSCSDEVGSLLRLLATVVRSTRVGEIGTGCGVGAAWLASGLAPGAELFTVEADEQRAKAAEKLLAASPVHVIRGDWHELLSLAPFHLLFADVGNAKQGEPALVLEALAPGGIVVLDDFTPEEAWDEQQRARWSDGDPVREFWLNHGALVASELRVNPTSSVIVAARRP